MIPRVRLIAVNGSLVGPPPALELGPRAAVEVPRRRDYPRHIANVLWAAAVVVWLAVLLLIPEAP